MRREISMRSRIVLPTLARVGARLPPVSDWTAKADEKTPAPGEQPAPDAAPSPPEAPHYKEIVADEEYRKNVERFRREKTSIQRMLRAQTFESGASALRRAM